jgi:hypothetical protein
VAREGQQPAVKMNRTVQISASKIEALDSRTEKREAGCAAPTGSETVKLTRQQISEAIALEAPKVPFTMPFFLAGELLKECRRQGLRKLNDTGPGYAVTVRITSEKPRPRAKCWTCGKDCAMDKHGNLHSHRDKTGEWCNGKSPNEKGQR